MTTEIGNFIFAALLFVFGIIYYGASDDIPSNMLEDPVGASGFPRLVSLLVIGLSVVLLVQSVQRLRSPHAVPVGVPPEPGADTERDKFRKSAILFLTIVVFLALFNIAGYLISVALLLLAVFLQSGTRFGWMPVVTAMAGATTFHLFFAELLGVRLPVGILPLPF